MKPSSADEAAAPEAAAMGDGAIARERRSASLKTAMLGAIAVRRAPLWK